MANTPDDPRHPQPGEPGAPRDPSELIEGLEPTGDKKQPDQPDKGPESSDSAIDLGLPEDGVELSGISVIEWASLQDASPPRSGAPIQVDSPSDADILGKIHQAPEPAKAEDDDAIDFMADLIEVEEQPIKAEAPLPLSGAGDGGPPSKSLFEALGMAEAEAPVPPPSKVEAPGHEGTENANILASLEESGIELSEVEDVPDEAIVLGEDVIDLETLEPAGSARKGDSAIDLGEDAIIEEQFIAKEDSAINLGEDALLESGIDLVAEDVIRRPHPAGEGSGRDLIAEGLESGIDLVVESERGESKKHDDDALEDFFQATKSLDDQSSAVDLGSSASIPAFDLDASKNINRPTASDSSINLEEYEERPILKKPTEEDLTDEGIDLDESSVIDEDASPIVLDKKPAKMVGDETEAIDMSGIDLDMDMGAIDKAHDSAPRLDKGDPFDSGVEEKLPPVKEKDKKGDKKVKPQLAKDDGDEEDDKPTKKGFKAASEDDSAKEKKAKPRGRAGAWLGGTFLGVLLGAGAGVGLLATDTVPIKDVKEAIGMAEEKKQPDTKKDDTKPQTPPVVAAIDHLKNGDLDKINATDLATIDETKPEQLVARAEHAWLTYVRDTKRKDPAAKLDANAEPVKKVLADLDKAVGLKSADALLLRGQIHERLGNVEKATADFKKGEEDFKADAAQKARFEAALLALELAPKVAHLFPRELRPQLAVLIFLALQQPMPMNPPKDEKKDEKKTPDEAGFAFLKAHKAHREKKYKEALDLLAEARKRHDARRDLLPNQRLNPASDNREVIFLMVCDQLTRLWALEGKLANPDYLAGKEEDRDKAVDAIIAKAETNARAAQLKDVGEKLFKGKAVAKVEDLEKHAKEERDASDKKIKGLEGTVEDNKKTITGLEKDLKTTKDTLTDTKKNLTAALDREKTLLAAQKDANAAFTELAAEMKDADGKQKVTFKDLKASKAGMLDELKNAVRVANMKDPKGTIQKLERDLATDRATLKERWEPEQMLAYWAALLNAERGRKDLHALAAKDIERVRKNVKATDEQKGWADLVQGLALRNEEKFSEAKPILEKAKDALKGDAAKVATAALKESTDPASYFIAKADALYDQGKTKEAVAALKSGIDVLTDKKQQGALYARRALMALEGAIVAGSTDLAAAKKDAEAAANAGAADGYYASGRIDEEQGKLTDAIKNYRAAIKANGDKTDEVGSRYRAALARVLIKSRLGGKAAVKPLPAPVGKAKSAAKTKRVSLSTRDLLSLLITLQAGLPDTAPEVKEAEKLADAILKNKNASFDARAQALAVKGLYTDALKDFAAGLAKTGKLAPQYANALNDLLKRHPRLKQPDSLTVADPDSAEKHYSAGLGFYFAKKYGNAEKEFRSAVTNDSADARYYYFLGLSLLAQGDREESTEYFDVAAKLERAGKPGRAEVSTALERVQGPMRATLNKIRNRPLEPAKKK